MTAKTYPGLFGQFLDWVKDNDYPHSHDTIFLYVEEKKLDEDQANWLFSIIRRSVNNGYLSDSWWD